MKISYCITACNEHQELENLLRFLSVKVRPEDEVIVQLDVNHTDQVLEVCNLFTNFNHDGNVHTHEIKNSKFYAFPLDNDFARFKNNLANNASGDYIFQIDADEIPHAHLVENLPEVLESNPLVEMYLVPRVNTVKDLTESHIKKWGWSVNERGWVNWPDYQTRIYKRTSYIKWSGKVHEQISGHTHFACIPMEEEWALNHPKTIERQIKQNSYYDTI